MGKIFVSNLCWVPFVEQILSWKQKFEPNKLFCSLLRGPTRSRFGCDPGGRGFPLWVRINVHADSNRVQMFQQLGKENWFEAKLSAECPCSFDHQGPQGPGGSCVRVHLKTPRWRLVPQGMTAVPYSSDTFLFVSGHAQNPLLFFTVIKGNKERKRTIKDHNYILYSGLWSSSRSFDMVGRFCPFPFFDQNSAISPRWLPDMGGQTVRCGLALSRSNTIWMANAWAARTIWRGLRQEKGTDFISHLSWLLPGSHSRKNQNSFKSVQFWRGWIWLGSDKRLCSFRQCHSGVVFHLFWIGVPHMHCSRQIPLQGSHCGWPTNFHDFPWFFQVFKVF